MSSEGWSQYAEYARHLDAVRAEESARTAGMREGAAEMSTHADDLEARLNGQGGMLTSLAGTLRLRRPTLDPIPPEGDERIDPATALSKLAGIMDRGDREARVAAERGYYPALLPGIRGQGRNLLVYGVAALAVLAVQGLAFSRTGAKTSPIPVLFVMPLIGFVVAYVVLRVGSRTRVAQETPTLSARLGFVLCFLIGPIGAVVWALSYKFR
jgi:hypothetical protein